MSYIPKQKHGLYNGKAVQPVVRAALTEMHKSLTNAEDSRVERSMSQGWGPPSAYSGNTHADGFSVDYLVGSWGMSLTAKVLALLRQAGFEAVLRIKGDNVGAAVPITCHHIHAAFKGKANAAALAAVTKPGGRWSDAHQLARLGGRRVHV